MTLKSIGKRIERYAYKFENLLGWVGIAFLLAVFVGVFIYQAGRWLSGQW